MNPDIERRLLKKELLVLECQTSRPELRSFVGVYPQRYAPPHFFVTSFAVAIPKEPYTHPEFDPGELCLGQSDLLDFESTFADTVVDVARVLADLGESIDDLVPLYKSQYPI